jgi:hypothetical protein
VKITEFMKGSGRETSAMEMDMKFLKMGIVIEGSIWTTNHTEKVFINGIMEKYMTESGFKDKKTVSEFGRGCSMTAIRVNGKITKLKDSVLINGVMGTDTRVNGLHL